MPSETNDKETGKEGGTPKGPSPRRGIQDAILEKAIHYALENPKDPSGATVLTLLALGSYHLAGKPLERIHKDAQENPLWAGIQALLYLASPGPYILPLNPSLSIRIKPALMRLAEELVAKGGGLRLGVRLMDLDPRLGLVLLTGKRFLPDTSLLALAEILSYRGMPILKRLQLESLKERSNGEVGGGGDTPKGGV